MDRSLRFLLTLLAALSLTACAALRDQLPGKSAPPAQPPPAAAAAAATPASAPEVDYASLPPDILYRILVGEIAGQRGNLAMSVRSYLDAAQVSDDPQIAERATRIAAFARDDKAALQAAQRWIALAPDNLEAREALAVFLMRDGQTDAAAAQFDHVVKNAGGEPERIYLQIVTLLSKEADKNVVMETVDRLVARNPKDPAAHFAYSQLALHVQDTDVARTQVDLALQLRPDWTEALIHRARVLVQQGETDTALAELKKIVDARPDDRELRLSYARLLLLNKHLDEARAQFEQIARDAPDDADTLYTLALLFMESQQTDQAEDYLKRVLKTGKRTSEAYYYLGRIEEFRKNTDRAMQWYGKVREGEYLLDAQIRVVTLRARGGDVEGARKRLHDLALQHPDMAQRLTLVEGEILTEAKRYDDALKLYNFALDASPADADLLYARALLQVRLDRIDLAEQDLRTVLAGNADNAHALNALGYTLADETTRYDEALGYIQRALELLPDDAAVLDSMGWVQYRLGRLEEAERYLRRAYEMSQDHEVAAHLGEVLWVKGDKAGAREVWQRALKEEPDSEVLRETMQRLQP